MEVKDTEIIEKATEFENRKHVYKSTNEKIVASREVKSLILELNEIYNIGSGQPTKVSEIVELAKIFTRSRGKIINIDPPEFHNNVQTQHFWLDTSKLKKLGFAQHITNEFIVKDLCIV